MCVTCNGLYSCNPALWVHPARVTHIINACCELWKMKTVALNTNMLAASSFQFSNRLLQRVEVYWLTQLQLEDIISPGKEQKCCAVLSITFVLALKATWKQALLLCFGITAMFSTGCGFVGQPQFEKFLLSLLLLSVLSPSASCPESCKLGCETMLKKVKALFSFPFFLVFLIWINSLICLTIQSCCYKSDIAAKGFDLYLYYPNSFDLGHREGYSLMDFHARMISSNHLAWPAMLSHEVHPVVLPWSSVTSGWFIVYNVERYPLLSYNGSKKLHDTYSPFTAQSCFTWILIHSWESKWKLSICLTWNFLFAKCRSALYNTWSLLLSLCPFSFLYLLSFQ